MVGISENKQAKPLAERLYTWNDYSGCSVSPFQLDLVGADFSEIFFLTMIQSLFFEPL